MILFLNLSLEYIAQASHPFDSFLENESGQCQSSSAGYISYHGLDIRFQGGLRSSFVILGIGFQRVFEVLSGSWTIFCIIAPRVFLFSKYSTSSGFFLWLLAFLQLERHFIQSIIGVLCVHVSQSIILSKPSLQYDDDDMCGVGS
jgi:hypothetical protein